MKEDKMKKVIVAIEYNVPSVWKVFKIKALSKEVQHATYINANNHRLDYSFYINGLEGIRGIGRCSRSSGISSSLCCRC